MASVHVPAATLEEMLRNARKGNAAAAQVIPREKENHWLLLVEQSETVNTPEMHAAEIDVYIAVAGTAELTLDGALADPKEKSPGQFVGSRITGGRTIKVAPGDVVYIPAGVPHQLKTTKTPYRQFVFKLACR
ncbi:MAG: hypothetical protein V2A58_09050 [Planctomycetota bacterium]